MGRAARALRVPPPFDHRADEPLPRYGLLLLAAVLSIAVQGIVDPGRVQQVVVTALGGAALVLAVRSAQLRPRLVGLARAAAILCIGVSVLRALGADVGEGAGRLMNAALLAFGPPAVAVGVVRDLQRTGRVRLQAVMGVLALYMLIGMVFAFLFGAIDQLGAHPLFTDGQPATISRCIYFSFITLNTVGYGDLVTSTNLGHTISVFEALIGQIYLVTVVSLIVSNLGRGREP